MLLKKLLSGIKNYRITGSPDLEVKGITDDSREVGRGFLFCAIKGLRSNGHQFIDQAIKKGANVVVIEEIPKDMPGGITVVKVDDTRGALGVIASNYFENPSDKLKVVGVTGTKGKTTTALFTYQLLTSLGMKVGLISSISAIIGKKEYDTGFHVTNPGCIALHSFLAEMVKAGCTHAVLEVSSHGVDQKRIAGVSFEVSVLTNIASEHLDYHKTFENYRDTKLAFLISAKSVIINRDDESFAYVSANIPDSKKLFTYSLNQKSDFNLQNTPEAKVLDADFNILNALAAYGVVSIYTKEVGLLKEKIKLLKLPEGRLEEVSNKLGVRIIIDFAHTPDSLENALSYLRRSTKKKLIALFGCAGERDPFKRPVMGKIASEIADTVILTAEDPRSENVYDSMTQIKSGVSQENLFKVTEIADRTEAIKLALDRAKKGDTVGFFGKGHEKSMNLDGKSEIPWSDRDLVSKILEDEK